MSPPNPRRAPRTPRVRETRPPRETPSASDTPPPRPTIELLTLAQQGDLGARDQLLARYLPRLERWASGRLPAYARSLLDTGDLVQETMLKVLQGLNRIEGQDPQAFQAYLRQAVLNRIRDQIRWAKRRPGPGELTDEHESPLPSPLEETIGGETLDRYEHAFAQLSPAERELLHLRIELDFEYEEIAAMTGRPSRDAVRMATQRALQKLALLMGHER